ncbi:MAG: SDR family NAD(P)-dependent oxidoreductase [Acetobacteraceae bacterium]|nr:SDR family NAD(P)-dependent oxidoreductase [Acetobacteraceae bacterium]
MTGRRAGGIINISSLLALSGTVPPNPLPYRAVYAGGKAYMLAFTQALAGELRGTGVRILVCLPGRVTTEFHTSQGIDITKLPPMMTADDLVTATLSGLAQCETVCVPALADAVLFDRIGDAQVAVLHAAALQPALAERYL